MQPSITVLMPVYNASAFLKEAIDSILNQTFRDFELLIIEDGADAATKAILMNYNDARMRIIHHQVNRGLIFSLNEGLQAARGKYIARMDADDISYPDRLARQYSWMEANEEVVVCGTQIEDAAGKALISDVPVEPAMIKASLLFSCCLAHPSVIMRKSVLLASGYHYDPDYIHGEDYDLWARISAEHLLANLPETLLKYRLHNEQVSSVHNEKQLQSIYFVQKNLLRALGLDVTEEDLQLHSSFALLRFEDSTDYCQKVSDWLMKIQDTNNKSGVYEQSALRKTLGRWWYSYCAFQVDKKLKLKSAIRNAKATTELLDLRQKVKLYIRLLIK